MIRAALYLWSLPWALCGLAFALTRGISVWKWDRGALLLGVTRPVWAERFAASTFAWIIVWRLGSLPNWPHERAHMEQGLALGPLFPLAYGLASAVAWLDGGDPYRDNALEVDARAKAGQA